MKHDTSRASAREAKAILRFSAEVVNIFFHRRVPRHVRRNAGGIQKRRRNEVKRHERSRYRRKRLAWIFFRKGQM